MVRFSNWLETKQLQFNFMKNDKKVVSFDFDGVLHSDIYPGTIHPINFDDADLTPRQDMISKLRQEAKSGNRIIIVSARCHDQPIYEFVKNHKLPVQDIFVTCNNSKIPILLQQGAIRHYDDNIEMEYEIEVEGVDIEFIYVTPEKQI